MSDDVTQPEEFKGSIPFFIGDQSYSNSAVRQFLHWHEFNAAFSADGELYGCLVAQIVKVFDDGRILAVVAQKLDEDQQYVMQTRAQVIDEEVRKRIKARKDQDAAEELKRESEELETKKLVALGREVRKKLESAEGKSKDERKQIVREIQLARDPEIREMAESMLATLALPPEKYKELLTAIGAAIGGVINAHCTRWAEAEGNKES